MKMKLLITGASGFIGSRFISSRKDRYELIEVSLRNTAVDDIDLITAEAVVHLAGLAHQFDAIDESEYFRVNRDLTVELARKAKEEGVRQFIYISSTKVYGDGEDDVFYNEFSDCVPTDPYGWSKLEAERELKLLDSEEFTVSIIRPPLVYGPGVKGNLLLFMKLARLPIPLPFKGVNNNRAMVYVDNLISLIDKLIDKRMSGTYTLTDSNRISTEDLIREIRLQRWKKAYLFRLPRFLMWPLKRIKPSIFQRLYGSFNVNCEHTLETLGYANPYSFKEGIAAMVQHFSEERGI